MLRKVCFKDYKSFEMSSRLQISNSGMLQNRAFRRTVCNNSQAFNNRVIRFLFILLFLSPNLYSLQTKSQNILPIGYIYHADLTENISISLKLFTDSTYSLKIKESVSSDEIFLLTLSMGEFNFLSDTLILNDTKAKFETRFLIRNSFLKPIIPNYNFLLNSKKLLEPALWLKLGEGYKSDSMTFAQYKSLFSNKDNFSEIVFKKVSRYKFKSKSGVIKLKKKKIVLETFKQVFFEGQYNDEKGIILFYNNDLNLKNSFKYYYKSNGDIVIKFDWMYYAYLLSD